MLLSSFFMVVISSCKKDQVKDYLETRYPPTLTASTSDLSLSFADAAKEALKLTWTNPNYQFTTGASSQDVSYKVEIDIAGNNFTNPQKQTVSVSKDLSISFPVATFNDYLLNQLVLPPGVEANLEIRVISSLGTNGAASLISNVLAITATPYAIPPKVNPPATGDLFLVGDATSGGWNNPVPVPEQQFTQISETLYEITVNLVGGKQYLFLPKNGDWSHKFACKKTADQSADGGDFGYDSSDNFPGPAAGGNYKISVDFQRGKYTVTKL